MASSQKCIFVVVLIALPLIACRLVYSLISDGHRFSIVGGDTTIQLCMATIKEFIVVLMHTVLGVFAPQSSVKSDSTLSGQQQLTSGNPGYNHLPHGEGAAQDIY
ncbi:hypothetical protein BDV29DRAFT_40882 [Aspergillus leporis]|jgi:hypothetical protein|uniref:DUF7702 domain-containing protein n=1 Tax=Aspergillus leporis TaxID=41062 RepID=A0A5N5XAL4_9EURO|nr:hypothetical protein BDV29DRAFT_40882 [Aspergillus leporis]